MAVVAATSVSSSVPFPIYIKWKRLVFPNDQQSNYKTRHCIYWALLQFRSLTKIIIQSSSLQPWYIDCNRVWEVAQSSQINAKRAIFHLQKHGRLETEEEYAAGKAGKSETAYQWRRDQRKATCLKTFWPRTAIQTSVSVIKFESVKSPTTVLESFHEWMKSIELQTLVELKMRDNQSQNGHKSTATSKSGHQPVLDQYFSVLTGHTPQTPADCLFEVSLAMPYIG